MKQHDYKAALESFKILLHTMRYETFEGEMVYLGETYNHKTIDAIIHALKLADKVTGEPSDKMVLAAIDRNDTEEGMIYEGVFKAMIEQAQREVE